MSCANSATASNNLYMFGYLLFLIDNISPFLSKSEVVVIIPKQILYHTTQFL